MKKMLFWLACFVSWLGLDLYLGQKQAKKQAPKRTYPKRKGTIDFICSGPEFFRQFFLDIRNARKRIYCLFYIIRDDRITGEFFHLLKEKARSGVDVCLLMDWQGSSKIKKHHLNSLKQAGVRVGCSRKPRLPYFFFSLQQRNHRKITVIDSNIAYLGGFNMGLEYMGESDNPNLSPWRDYHLRLSGPSAIDLESEFIADWNEENQPYLQPHEQAEDHGSGIEHLIVPSGSGNLEEKLIGLVRSAKRSIFIGTPYFVPSALVFNELIGALARGVHVTVLIPKHEDHPFVQEAARPFLKELMRFPTARIQSFTNGFYHAKIIIFDEEVCDIGTANFDARSQRINFECNCFIYGKDFIKQIRPFIEKDLCDSETLGAADLSVHSIGGKAKTKAAYLLRDFL